MASISRQRMVLALPLVALAGILGWWSFPHHVKAETDAEAHAAARHAYSQKISTTYNFRYGTERPFAPSNMTTENGEFIDPKDFPTAQYCGHCHQAAHAQWRESAHSNSNRPPWYLKNVGLLNTEKGIEFSRHCEGCHDPIATVAGALTQAGPKKRPYDQDGVTCSVCHSIQKVDLRGTGSFTLGVPAVLVDESGQPIHRAVSDSEILSHLDRHSAAVMKPFYRSSDFCAACHKAALPHDLNDYKWQRAISLYDEWQNSSFAKQSPLPFYKKDAVSTCQACHMGREALVGRDPGAKNGQFASHRWLGANSVIPEYYHYSDQAEKIKTFLQNSVFNIDIFALERETPDAANSSSPLIAPLGRRGFEITANDKLTVSVVIQNKGIAHSHVPEQRDMYESWVDFTVKNAAGKTMLESGALGTNGYLDPAAHSFTNRLINKQGTLNELHQVWTNRVIAYNNTIQSGRSQVVRYSFTVPKGEAGPFSVTATVRYRRFDQRFADFGIKDHYVQPVIDMQSTTRTFNLGENKPVDPPAGENPEWMRWNNYGIALLDAQQYAGSVNAFERVAKMRPDYADAFTNIAIAQIQWEKYSDALPNLHRSLELAPENARALYYLALVERNEGQLTQAIEHLQNVARQFPLSRDAHRELGFSFYQLRKYDEARAEYQKLQAIDPDDLAAHYNLAILYRRMGDKDKARAESAYFADQKDDPGASVYALEYLRKHGEVARESIPWHVHDLDAHGVAEPGTVTADMVPSQQTP